MKSQLVEQELLNDKLQSIVKNSIDNRSKDQLVEELQKEIGALSKQNSALSVQISNMNKAILQQKQLFEALLSSTDTTSSTQKTKIKELEQQVSNLQAELNAPKYHIHRERASKLSGFFQNLKIDLDCQKEVETSKVAGDLVSQLKKLDSFYSADNTADGLNKLVQMQSFENILS